MAKNQTLGSVAETQDAVAQNFVLNYRRDHPKNRCSYGIAGTSGIVVFDKGLFAGSDAPDFVPPATITLDCALVLPKADSRETKEAEKAARAAEKAEKAEARVKAQQAKAEATAAKAREALEKAQARIKAAEAKAAAEAKDAPEGTPAS